LTEIIPIELDTINTSKSKIVIISNNNPD